MSAGSREPRVSQCAVAVLAVSLLAGCGSSPAASGPESSSAVSSSTVSSGTMSSSAAPSTHRASTEPAIEVVGPPKSVTDLAWMSGTWTSVEGETIQEERWNSPLGGLLLGTGRTVVGGRARFFEYLRIEERDDGLVYVASPLGRGTTDFRLTDGGARRVRFENPAHDWPTSIEYELRADGHLMARVSGPGKLEEYVWARTP